MTRTKNLINDQSSEVGIKDIKLPRLYELPCYLLVLSLFFPTRGTIVGLTFYVIQIFSLALFALTSKRAIVSRTSPFVCVLLASIIIMDLHHFSASNWWYYLSNLLPLILAFLFIPSRIKTRHAFDRFVRFIILVFTIYSVFCIIESITSFNIFDALTNTKIEEYSFTNEIRFGYVRNRGAIDISINNGMLLCLVLSLAAFYIIHSHKKAFLICYALIFLAAFFSLSRTVWIQLGISQILIFLSIKAKQKLRVLFFVFAFSFF